MADVALQLAASPLPVSTGNNAGEPAPAGAIGAHAKATDPFAALLASATGTPRATAPHALDPTSAAAALLASTAAPAITAATPLPTATVETLTGTAVSLTSQEKKSDSSDSDKDDQGSDPLADAIASGATAVLALAPAIAAATPNQPTVAVPPGPDTRVAGVTPAGLPRVADRKMAADSFAFASTGQHPDEEKLPSGQAVVTTALATEPLETELPQATGKSDSATIASPVPAPAQDAAAGADTRMSPGPQPTIPSSPDAAASLPVVPARKAEAQPATDVTPARTEPLPTTDSDAQRTAVVRPEASAVTKAETMPAASHPAARQNAAPAHRRSTAEVAAPRRGADTRRRIDIPAGETASAALPQHATETAQSGELVSATVQAKGDTIVQQTLTVARDGAWLDKLAHDIASSAGNGGDLQFKLDPERLGSLTVAINQSADGASIRLTADNETTRNLLIEAQPRLLAEAHAQGLRVSDTHVDLNQHQTANQNQGQQQQQSQQQQPQSHQNQSQDMARWAQGNGGQNGTANGQNRQSSPGHQPFVSNLARKGEAETESSGGDSDALYA